MSLRAAWGQAVAHPNSATHLVLGVPVGTVSEGWIIRSRRWAFYPPCPTEKDAHRAIHSLQTRLPEVDWDGNKDIDVKEVMEIIIESFAW